MGDHFPHEQFLGYNFRTYEWSEWNWVIHTYAGYATIVCTCQQIYSGVLKNAQVDQGTVLCRYHGLHGKLTIVFGGFALLMAISFWPWSNPMKSSLIILVIVLTFAAIGVEKPKETFGASVRSVAHLQLYRISPE